MEMEIDHKFWTFDRIAFLSVVVAAAFGFAIIGWAAHDASEQAKNTAKAVAVKEERRNAKEERDRKERVKQINQTALEQCREIESLKKQWRDDTIRRTREDIAEAHDDFARLDETLMILGIEKSDVIVNRAVKDRNDKIADSRANRDSLLIKFKPEKCPRKVIE